MAKVKCAVCGLTFDYEKEPAAYFGATKRRYAHLGCYPEGERVPLKPKVQKVKSPPKDLEKQELYDYCKELFKGPFMSPLIQKQIKDYVAQGCSYSGILKTLMYWHDVKGNSFETSKGIGIVPYIYKEAYNYYHDIYIAQQLNKDLDIQNHRRDVYIDSPRIKKKPKLYKMEEDEDV